MNDSSPNIQFNYLYRDGGNYKSYGSVVFANPESLSLTEVEKKIKACLIDGEFFDPRKWKLTPITPENWDSELDHSWSEFESIHPTTQAVTASRTVGDFLAEIAR